MERLPHYTQGRGEGGANFHYVCREKRPPEEEKGKTSDTETTTKKRWGTFISLGGEKGVGVTPKPRGEKILGREGKVFKRRHKKKNEGIGGNDPSKRKEEISVKEKVGN